MSDSDLHDSCVATSPVCCGASLPDLLCKIVKHLLHIAVIIAIFTLILLPWNPHDLKNIKVTVFQSVSYAAIACLFICTSSDLLERIVSGIFLGILAVVFVVFGVTMNNHLIFVMYGCNVVAISAYCFWKIIALVQQAKACLRRRRGRTKAPAADAEAPTPAQLQQTTFHIDNLPRKFSYEEIRAVTGDFGTLVGRGGSAHVFRGLLDDGTAVAVKQLIADDRPVVGEGDFLREVSIVAGVHHRSMVRLLGYCFQRGVAAAGPYLVYPFFENGSLDRWLFTGEEQRRLLPWPARRRIAGDVAKALAYLHHGCRQQILHLDIKPANILLDGDLRAHVSDFGISMSIAEDQSSVITRGRGTRGYMAPEMWASSMSTKSDVYSYGMTILELVAGRRSFEPGSIDDASSEAPEFFGRFVLEKIARGMLMEVVVDAAMPCVDEAEVEALVKVALCCVQHRRDVRPSMLTVVDMLEGRVAAELPSESRLSIVDFMYPFG